jgi:hypothetical protein
MDHPIACLSRRLPAIDQELRSRDEPGLVRCAEEHEIGSVLGFAHSPSGRLTKGLTGPT